MSTLEFLFRFIRNQNVIFIKKIVDEIWHKNKFYCLFLNSNFNFSKNTNAVCLSSDFKKAQTYLNAICKNNKQWNKGIGAIWNKILLLQERK